MKKNASEVLCMFEKLISFLDSYSVGGAPGYDCLIYQNGREIFRHFGGYTDVENKIPPSGKERYNLYSCSKPITVSAALLLYEEGLFRLDDPLALYLPEFAEMKVKDGDTLRAAKTPIRMRDLFAMTAGFTYNTSSPALQRAKQETEGRCPTREVMKYLAEEPLSFDPSTRWQYSLCHDVLAAVVEVLAKERFNSFVKRRIFDPLGMTESTYALSDEERETLTEQYIHRAETNTVENFGKGIAPFKLGTDYESGGAGCASTVEDYMRFLEGLRTGKILRPETVRLMQTDVLTEESRATFWLKDNYGYGLGVRCPRADGTGATDFGWDGAAGSYLSIDLPSNLSVLYMTHLRNAPINPNRSCIIDLVKADL